jgi:hypothetical protein
MMHVFLLMVYLGTGDERKLVSNNMYFYSIDRCNYFASQVSKRYGNFKYNSYLDPKDRVTSYCLPKYINTKNIEIY